MTQNKPKLNVTCILDLLENASVGDLDRLGEEPIVFARELKLVIQGLLEEIENLKQNNINYSENKHSKDPKIRKVCECPCCNRVSAYENSITLIKKAFEGVIE